MRIAAHPRFDRVKNKERGKAMVYLSHEKAREIPVHLLFLVSITTASKKKERTNSECCPFPTTFLHGVLARNRVTINSFMAPDVLAGSNRKRQKNITAVNRTFEKAHSALAVDHSH